MKSGWEYVDENGVREKLAPNILAENVLMTEDGPALPDAIRDIIHPMGSVRISVGKMGPMGGQHLPATKLFCGI